MIVVPGTGSLHVGDGTNIDKDTMLLLKKIEAQSVKKDGHIFCVLGFHFLGSEATMFPISSVSSPRLTSEWITTGSSSYLFHGTAAIQAQGLIRIGEGKRADQHLQQKLRGGGMGLSNR